MFQIETVNTEKKIRLISQITWRMNRINQEGKNMSSVTKLNYNQVLYKVSYLVLFFGRLVKFDGDFERRPLICKNSFSTFGRELNLRWLRSGTISRYDIVIDATTKSASSPTFKKRNLFSKAESVTTNHETYAWNWIFCETWNKMFVL